MDTIKYLGTVGVVECVWIQLELLDYIMHNVITLDYIIKNVDLLNSSVDDHDASAIFFVHISLLY